MNATAVGYFDTQILNLNYDFELVYLTQMLDDKVKLKEDEEAKLKEAQKPKATNVVKPRRVPKPTIHKETQTVPQDEKPVPIKSPILPKPKKFNLGPAISLTEIPIKFRDERIYKPKITKPTKTETIDKPDGEKGKI